MQNILGESTSISQAIALCLQKNLFFAAYRLPNTSNSEIVIQKSDQKKVVGPGDKYAAMKGFLVEPFVESNECKPFIILSDIYARDVLSSNQISEIDALPSIAIQSDHTNIPEEVDHTSYLEQLNEIIEKIKTGTFEKVVLSRVKLLQGNYVSKLPVIFDSLTDKYPGAFVFIFNAGRHLWVGATPEPFLKVSEGAMQTVSLAGTRPLNEDNLNIGSWNSKERLEQEYVTRYISKVLSKFNLVDVEQEGPYTKKAGNLVHLRTDFSFRADELENCLGDFLHELHPTPAVCGMPRRNSLTLLQELEKHNREYYAGFVGPVGLNDRITLFVNLRCMKVLENNLALFVGGGITADSNAEDEWQETEMKSQTLLSVIHEVEE